MFLDTNITVIYLINLFLFQFEIKKFPITKIQIIPSLPNRLSAVEWNLFSFFYEMTEEHSIPNASSFFGHLFGIERNLLYIA